MKPRPTSLYVPKTDSQAQPPAIARSASLQRLPLDRAVSADMVLPKANDAMAPFMTGKFADPKAKKARLFDMGAPLFTEGHARLIAGLREECARLHGYAVHLTGKVSELSSAHVGTQLALQDSKATMSTLREHNRRMLAANQALVADLKTATDSLAEVDAMFLNVSKKRMSRLSEASQVHPQDMAYGPDVVERPKSPTPNRAYGRSAVSLDVES